MRGLKFEEYLKKTVQQICEDQPIDRVLFETRIRVFLGLVDKGVKPARARRIMDLYLEGN